MKIEVQFFSRLRDVVGAFRLERELPAGQTVGDLLVALYAEYPPLREWDAHILTAVGLEYAQRDQPLRDGDSVSVMPPVQGG
jgi:MoaD family protein